MSQQPIARVVSEDLILRCLGPDGTCRDVAATFSYDLADPYAVRVDIPWHELPVRWSMCRNLVSLGLTDPVGEGDVQMWPSTDEAGRGIVVMDLWSADQHFVGEVSTRELYRFLTRTLAVVPFGSERRHFDVDLMIADLLSQAE